MKKTIGILCGLALVVALAALGRKVSKFSHVEHERFQTELWRLKQTDTTFNEDVLKARFALLDNYDDFQVYEEEMVRTFGALSQTPSFITFTGRNAIEQARADYAALQVQRRQLLDRFKSQNAMLANSRRYLPVALDELAARLGETEDDRKLAALVGDLTRLTLMRLSNPDELSVDAPPRLQRLFDWSSQHPSHPEAKFVPSLARHARNILAGNEAVDTLTRQLLAIPTEAAIERFFRAYEGEVAIALRRAQQYRTFLYLLSFALVAGIGYTLWALRSANRHLEQRVEARTRDLARSEEQFRTLCVASPMGILMADAAGSCSYTNPCYETISGLATRECLGDEWARFVHPDDRASVLAGWLAAARAGEKYSHEYRGQSRSEGSQWVAAHAAPIRGADGKVTGYVATVEDITERRRNEEKVTELNQQLRDTSRQAGMAEVATGVLHNVGNVLNSVNVSAIILTDKVRQMPVPDLARLIALLREQGANLGAFFSNDPRGSKVCQFLSQIADKFTRQQETQLQELVSLGKNIDHIKEIVAMQQSYARISGVSETVNVVELVEDTLRMNAESFQRHELRLVRDFAPDLPSVSTEKHKVLQILVNLVRNAGHACDASAQTDKEITVRVAQEQGRVRIQVTDNGVGIPPENLTRIFNHGFTTKKDGHGFGLHSGANSAKELGGSLTAQSDGPGRGATFTLELPEKPLQKVAA